MTKPSKFLERYSGKIVGVGDIFDFYRSSVLNEKATDYIKRTEKWWKHIEVFIEGNHDSMFMRRFKDIFQPIRIYRRGPVLALHGHQLKFTYKQAEMIKYEQKWDVETPQPSLFWDFEEWVLKKVNKFFKMHGKRAYAQALTTLEECEKRGILDDRVKIIITGHTHLPFKTKVTWKGKEYKVVNCGSSLHEKKFNPVYVPEIDRWFVSDLHLGTAKSVLN